MQRRQVVRGEGETRQRILEAAVGCFAKASYDDVALRDIAAEVGVDVSYVHRSFGSKENLFREVLKSLEDKVGLSQVEAEGLSAYLARMLVERGNGKNPEAIEPLLILVRSLTSPKAGRLVSERLQSEFIEPIAARLGDPALFRAAMITSLLIGLSILRNLLQLPAAMDINAEDAEAVVANAVDWIIRIPNASNRGEA
jgi:AcrR family transcriptional regulator